MRPRLPCFTTSHFPLGGHSSRACQTGQTGQDAASNKEETASGDKESVLPACPPSARQFLPIDRPDAPRHHRQSNGIGFISPTNFSLRLAGHVADRTSWREAWRLETDRPLLFFPPLATRTWRTMAAWRDLFQSLFRGPGTPRPCEVWTGRSNAESSIAQPCRSLYGLPRLE